MNRLIRAVYCSALRLLGNPSVVARRGGIRWHLDLAESFDARLFFRASYEPETWRLLRSLVRPDMTVFDVGANMGIYALRVARLLDPDIGGRIIAFEPTAYAFGRLRRNVELNELGALTIERLALADRVGTERIERRSGTTALPFRASWRLDRRPIDADVDLIEFDTMDRYVEQKGVERVDLIKIDVDGYEYRVLRGGRRTLERHRPRLIMELGHTVGRVGDTLNDVLDLLADLGYTVDGVGHDTAAFDGVRDLADRSHAFNVLCTPQDGT